MTKKVISIVLSVIMVVTLIPSIAFATTTGQTDGSHNQGEVTQPVDPKPETKPEVVPPPVTPPTEATLKVTFDQTGDVKWNSIAEGDTDKEYSVAIEKAETADSWVNVEPLTVTISSDNAGGFVANFDLSQYEESVKFRATVTYTKEQKTLTGTSNEVTGTKKPAPQETDKKVNFPNVTLDYHSDLNKKYVNGLKVTIKPFVGEGNEADSYDVYLYASEYGRNVDINTGEGLTDKDIVKKDSVNITDNKPIELIYDKTYFYNEEETHPKPYYVKVVAKKKGDYIPAIGYKEKDALANDPTIESSMKAIQIKDKPNVIQAVHENLVPGSVFRGYVKIYSSFKDSKGEYYCVDTKEVFGTVDGEGKATYNMDIGDYIFAKDNLKVRAYIEGEGLNNHHYSVVTINNFKPTKPTTKKAIIDATIDENGDLYIYVGVNSPATVFDYVVKYKNSIVKREYDVNCHEGKIYKLNEWMNGINAPSPLTNPNDYELIITGRAFNCADHVVVVRPKVKKTLYGSIKINLPSSKPGGYATVDLSNLYPLEARNSISYVWYLDGRAVSYDSRYYITSSDLGKTLRVAVSGYNNIKGTVSSPSVTIDSGKPVIKTQPTGYKHYIGDYKQALYVYATTTGSPLKYQWYKDGVAITGATSNSYTPTTEYRGKDEYYCKVYNQEGYVFSNIAVVHNLIRVGTPVLKATKNRYSLVLRWSAADNAKKYKVYERKGGKYKCIKTTTKTYLTVKVRLGSKHVYKIKAINGGCYSYSKPKRFTAKR